MSEALDLLYFFQKYCMHILAGETGANGSNPRWEMEDPKG